LKRSGSGFTASTLIILVYAIFEAVRHAPVAHPVMHEKTIAQSRDRQGADPLADARGSVRASIFGTDCG
jgi:hypothetical protein